MTVRRGIRPVIALALCAGLIATSPAASFSSSDSSGAASAKKKCKKVRKGKKKVKKCTPVKKKATPTPANVPADGRYAGTDGVKITVSTAGGKRVVEAVVTVQTSCDVSGQTQVVPLPATVSNMPLVGSNFTATGGASHNGGQPTITGTFLSTSRVHLIAQVKDANPYPGLTCGGTADVTTDLQPGS